MKEEDLVLAFDILDYLWLEDNKDLFNIALGDLTPRELQKYESERSTKEKDITFYLWSYNVTYAYESYWAMILEATEEELKEYGVNRQETLPDNFKPDTKLKEIYPT